MTKELLGQYQNICDKLKHIYANQPPYNGEALKLLMQKNEIEAFVDSLPWEKQKLVRAVMQHGTRWDVVRREIHSLKSADALRMEFNRIF